MIMMKRKRKDTGGKRIRRIKMRRITFFNLLHLDGASRL